MKKNISTPDRLIRVALAILLMMLMLNNYEDQVIRFLSAILGIYCIVTALLEICMLYNVLKISTRVTKRDKRFY